MVSIYVYNIWIKQQIFKSVVSQVAWAIKVSMTGDPPDSMLFLDNNSNHQSS